MTLNVLSLAFATAFVGCVLAVPLVTRLAAWSGAIDRPDHFRRIHKGAIPRLGGLGLALGLALCLIAISLHGDFRQWSGFPDWAMRQFVVAAAAFLVLLVGATDDTHGLTPRIKLLGQALAVGLLYAGGIRIEGIEVLGNAIAMSTPLDIVIPNLGASFRLDPLGLLATLLWFLACMNIWNLIDGMDGLASGVGLLVSGTLMLVAVCHGNLGSAVQAAALAGCLAGFLLYNWHPACIFLGDSGSLLIGLLIGVIGVQDSLKGSAAVSILFPILAMGLPISDTAMAILRRWVRELPLSAADRRHIHHLLIGLGLTTRQAAMVLYVFTAGLCGVVLLGVAWRNEALALILGASGCLAFLLVLTSRRDELTQLLAELRARSQRKRHERRAARITWEFIQRIEVSDTPECVWSHLVSASRALGRPRLKLSGRVGGILLCREPRDPEEACEPVSCLTSSFRLVGGADMDLTVSFRHEAEPAFDADITFRSVQRIALAASRRAQALSYSPEAPQARHDVASGRR
jgi:UDP-GlcNAc:undecaprenyl-phosphate GlcNAc-1-phosphate transferase